MLINYFVCLTVLFLMAGLALDAGMVELRRLQLQHSADAASIGALFERSRGYSDWVATGKADAALNGFTDGANGVTITIQSPPTQGAYIGDTTAIQALAAQTYHTAFMGLAGMGGNATLASISVAKASPNTDCVYIMGSGSGYYPLHTQSFASLSSACNIYVDSTGHSIETDLFSSITVSGSNVIKVQGTAGSTYLLGSLSPTPTYGSANENDPLASESAPVFSTCNYTNKSIFFSSATLNPGTYCGGITINIGTVTFNPGLYIITGGLNWNFATVNGTGVTLFLTSGGGYSMQNFTISNSHLSLSAPTSGSLTGIVVFGDRNWSGAGSQGVQMTSSTVVTDGIWYVLNTGISNNAFSFTATKYLGIVTDNLNLSGNATVTVPSPDYTSLSGGSPYLGGSTGGFVQ